jgi:hypothetical protein
MDSLDNDIRTARAYDRILKVARRKTIPQPEPAPELRNYYQ